MKIQNNQTSMRIADESGTSSKLATYFDLIRLVCDAPGRERAPLTPSEMRERTKIVEKLYKDGDEDGTQIDEADLTAEQIVKVKRLANDFPWLRRSKALVVFLDYIDALSQS